MAKQILVVGSVAIDDIETPAGHRSDSLGGSATYFSTGASFFAPIRLVAVVGSDFDAAELDDLRSRGVDLEGLEQVPGKTFRWAGRYGADFGDAETLDTQLNVFEDFDPKIPESYRETPLVFLANIHPELQGRVLDAFEGHRPELIGADTMNFWITGQRDALLKVLSRIDLLVINETEAHMLSGKKNIYDAADAIRAMGPKILVIKRGAYGALLFHPDGLFVAPSVPLRKLADPTGAGDTFASGLMGYLATCDTLNFEAFKRGVLAGTVLASFACEGFSFDRVKTLTRVDFDERMMQLRALISVD